MSNFSKMSTIVAAVAALSFPAFAQEAKPHSAPAASSAAAKGDIVDTAVKAGKFNTLAKALGAAELVDTLKGAGPFTVFAPTDEAFAKLPEGAVEDLLKPENKAKLQEVLKAHVVSGKVTAADVVKVDSAKGLAGNDLKVTTSDGKVMIGDATVIKADVMASNGVIHVIDTVIMP